MAPRQYLSGRQLTPLQTVSQTAAKKRSPDLLSLPLEAWEDNQFWHSAKDAAVILQERCGKEGFSYEALLDSLENEYVQGFHWFKRGSTYKLNIWRFIKYPPGTLDLG